MLISKRLKNLRLRLILIEAENTFALNKALEKLEMENVDQSHHMLQNLVLTWVGWLKMH